MYTQTFYIVVKFIACITLFAHMFHTHALSLSKFLFLHSLLLFLLHDVIPPVTIHETNFIVLHGIGPHSSALFMRSCCPSTNRNPLPKTCFGPSPSTPTEYLEPISPTARNPNSSYTTIESFLPLEARTRATGANVSRTTYTCLLL